MDNNLLDCNPGHMALLKSAVQSEEEVHPHRTASMPFVSVVVPVFNDAESLTILLRALAQQNYPRQRFECVVVDNSSEEPICIPPDCPCEVRVFREPRCGSYVARNRGIQEARGEVLAFTDADCIPQPDWLSSAVALLQLADEPAMVAGRVEVVCRGAARPSIAQWHSVVNDLDQSRFLAEYHFAATANMITTRDVFQRVGDFDPQFFSGGDLQWGQRAWSNGIQQLYAENIVVRHPARATWKSLVCKTRRIAGGHYLLTRGAGRTVWGAMTMTLRIARASLRRSWHDPRLPTLVCRLRVMLLEAALRFIQLCEIIRLRLGGQPRRR